MIIIYFFSSSLVRQPRDTFSRVNPLFGKPSISALRWDGSTSCSGTFLHESASWITPVEIRSSYPESNFGHDAKVAGVGWREQKRKAVVF